MKKRITWIGTISILALTALAFTFFSNSTTAEIPSASSYAPTFKDWTVHFSEKMNPETFTNDTVTVINDKDEQISISFEWDDLNNVLTIKAPENGYTIDQTYQITISDHVKTANGENLSDSFTHTFTTVADLPKIENKKQLVTLLKERTNQTRNQLFSEESETIEMSNDSTDTAASGESSATSDTNVQVAGIDEGDKIKNDSNFIYFVRENDIVITTSEKENSKLVSKVEEKDFQPLELYLHNDYLISIGYSQQSIRDEGVEESTNTKQGTDIAIYPIHRSQTTAYIYDISDISNPSKVREVTLEGSFTASRKTDEHIYLIANERPPFQILEDQDAEIRPFIKDTAISDESKPLDFEEMYFFPESEEDNFLLVTSINLNEMEKEAKVDSYLGASNEMYMSEDHMYIAVNKYNNNDKENNDGAADIMIARPAANTEIIQFKIDDGAVNYNASTIVNGTLINQFAMDERNDTFRVATTKGDMWQDDEPSTNNLYTFDSNLNPMGSVEGLAEGERIYSVRFMEDVAYMVTFKQVDPLFVIDLKDPKEPTVLGELKIPGFSNYLHPLDENHVVGFGQNTKLVENEHGSEPLVQMDGLKISLFDVSDPTNPKEKYSEIIGQGSSYTELSHNHKALYKHPTENLFGFPAVLFESKTVQKGDITYEDQSYLFEGALLYNITPDDGIKLKDTITHQQDNIDYAEWESEIKRIISVDDTIYTFSHDQFKVYDMNEESVIEAIELPEQSNRY